MIGVSVGTRFLARGAVWATRVFFDLGRQGPPLPDGPVLVVANHPNSIADALVIFCVAGRRVRPLARAPLFTRAVVGQVLRDLGALPVYRPQDDPTLVGRNESTFDAAIAALRQGDAVLVFPEGVSHSQPELAPLKTGAARIALRAEEAHGWTLGLVIVPVGLTYRRKSFFRGEAAAFLGESFLASAYRAAYERDPAACVRDLTTAMAAALEAVLPRLASAEDEALLDAAEALYRADRESEGGGETPKLAERLPRLQLFAAGMEWLRAHDAPRFEHLAAAVRSYRYRLSRLGLDAGELPLRGTARETLQALGVDALLTVIGLPLAVLGVAVWYLPYIIPRLVVNWRPPAYEARASVKLATALAAFPIAYVTWLVLAWKGLGWAGFLPAALLLPIAGLVTLHWREHWADLREELEFWLRALGRHGLTAQLRARRHALANAIDRVAGDWEEEKRRRAEQGRASVEGKPGSASSGAVPT
jgi:1-acyl-sn-glycerol-3-phosphate acyltransferase